MTDTRPPTMAQIAEHAGAALSTVSYVLSGKRPVSEEMRKRVLAAIEELNYRPHGPARALASGASHTIALFLPSPNWDLVPVQQTFVAGATQATSARGYGLLLSTAPTDPGTIVELINDHRADGAWPTPVFETGTRVGMKVRIWPAVVGGLLGRRGRCGLREEPSRDESGFRAHGSNQRFHRLLGHAVAWALSTGPGPAGVCPAALEDSSRSGGGGAGAAPRGCRAAMRRHRRSVVMWPQTSSGRPAIAAGTLAMRSRMCHLDRQSPRGRFGWLCATNNGRPFMRQDRLSPKQKRAERARRGGGDRVGFGAVSP